ncbi:ankyrin repeat domain-containing protein [Wolbachia endosymbiont of Zaprionus taronus]|uniref:ankyrin repeat domain-containing protein n=1 Tax=Wolbachia endosymbiont of Zaprionus taronus TaxID=2603208 RepID=UPI002949A4EA|nr:ankyrin repeat domain-containing protein [Wolbachia endosymbiont of Zaprionus taronus]MDV6248741.1 ankyrin repeat domain-containing protein [Wolbachia endosymbiont of Zaprionus taronus]
MNLINGLPRDYFAKTFDQVNYLDKRVWEGMFRANIEEIKEQLELGVSESMFEADLVKLQGLVGKYTLSPVVYEDGLKELESFVSNLDNFCNYSKVLAEVKGEFREELRAQPSLLKGCIESDTDLGRGGNAYYNSLLDERGKKKALVTELPILDEVVVSKGRETNFRLRNISKLFLCNPGQAITLFLAVQVAVANAYSSNSTTVENSVLPFSNESFELKVSTSDSVSMQNTSSEDGRFVEILDVKVKESKEEGRLVEGLNHSSNSSNQGVERYKLFSNSTSPRVRVKRGKFVKGNDDVSLSSQITSLKATIDRQDSELKELRAKLSDNGENSRVRISVLEEQKTSLKKSLDDMEKKSEQELSEKNSEIQNLMISVNQFSTEVSDLKKKIEEMELKHRLTDECIKYIQDRKFEDAENKLKEMNHSSRASLVISQMHDKNMSTFDLLLSFGEAIRDIRLKSEFYSALCSLSDHLGGDRTKLIRSFESNPKFEYQNIYRDIYKGSDRNTLLHYAAKEGDLNMVMLSICEGVGLHVKNSGLQTPLHLAARWGKLNVVKFLVDKGADFDLKDIYNDTPLHEAAFSGELGIVEFLINRGASLNVKNSISQTPLHLAACSGKLNVVKFLVDKGADVHARDEWGHTPRLDAFHSGGWNQNILEFLYRKEQGGSRKKRDAAAVQSHSEPSSYLSDVASEKAEKIGKNHSLV